MLEKLKTSYRYIEERQSSHAKFISCSSFANVLNANTENLSISQIFYAYLIAKSSIFVFPEFLEDFKFLENRNVIFESSFLKAFFRQSFRVFDFSNLASHSRYLQSVTLNPVAITRDLQLKSISASEGKRA